MSGDFLWLTSQLLAVPLMGEGIRGHKQKHISPSAPPPWWCSLSASRPSLRSALRAQFAGNVSRRDWFEMADSLTSCLYKARQLLGEIKFLQELERHIFSICLTESLTFARRVNKKTWPRCGRRSVEPSLYSNYSTKPPSLLKSNLKVNLNF